VTGIYYRWTRRGGDAGEGVRKNQKPTMYALYLWKLSQKTSVGRSESGGEPLARLTSTFRNGEKPLMICSLPYTVHQYLVGRHLF
jgi:hypothetical protein